MNKQQSGFTLIELIMVIVILGVLSAFAVPKFADLSQDANLAAVEGARAAIKSASGIAHAADLVEGDSSSDATGSVSLEGTAISLVFGYPAATAAAIGVAAGIECGGDFTCTANATTPPSLTISNGTCQFDYDQAANASTPPVIDVVTCP